MAACGLCCGLGLLCAGAAAAAANSAARALSRGFCCGPGLQRAAAGAAHLVAPKLPTHYAETRDRAGDLQIFWRALPQLSYRGRCSVPLLGDVGPQRMNQVWKKQQSKRWARGVVASRPLSMGGGLGSSPSESIARPHLPRPQSASAYVAARSTRQRWLADEGRQPGRGADHGTQAPAMHVPALCPKSGGRRHHVSRYSSCHQLSWLSWPERAASGREAGGASPLGSLWLSRGALRFIQQIPRAPLTPLASH